MTSVTYRKISIFENRLSRKRRDASTDFAEKASILQNFETYLPSLISLPPGSNGHDCILRAICEVARTPRTEDGLMGEVINILFNPLQHLHEIPISGDSDYIKAQQIGRWTQNCTQYQTQCSVTFFEVRNISINFVEKNNYFFCSIWMKICNYSSQFKFVNFCKYCTEMT